jgi:hypothetical protein
MTEHDDAILNSRLRVPDHVVHRNFVAETVVLNLKTGKYHGLNPTAGRMLSAFDDSTRIRDVAAQIAEEYQEDQATVEADLVEFCHDLLARELVEVVVDETP